MSSLLNELTSITHNNEESIRQQLNEIIPQAKSIEVVNLDVIQPLFCLKSKETLKLTAETIAELAKSESNRKVLTVKRVTDFLLALLKNEENAVVTQACRALGNICFENEDARQLIGREGVKTLVSVIELSYTCGDAKLQTMACGFMLNLLMGNEILQKAALEFSILHVVEDILKEQLNNLEVHDDCCMHLLLSLSMLTDGEVDVRLSEGFCYTLVDLLKVSKNPEISILCMEIIHGQSEDNNVKLFFAKRGICELVYELVEKYKSNVDDDDSRAILKMACDTIVLILTGDEPMDLLYDNGNGIVFKNMVSWLYSDDFDLLSTGVLALGNFARNDAHCTQMVQDGIAKKLLDLLSKHNGLENNIKVQHALLSALRNLVILPQNKRQILNEGLVNILYPMLNITHSHVTFKLLGTLRIVIDGQEETALDLLTRKDLLEKLVDWCSNSDHLGVRGEASRMLAWLVKHCHSTRPYSIMLNTKDCVKCLVDMISSNHAVMQNEAFYALTLLSKGSKTSSELDQLLVDSDIGKNLNFLVTKHKDKLDEETVTNLLTLLECLKESQIVVEHMRECNVKENLRELFDNKNLAALHDRLKQVSSAIDSG